MAGELFEESVHQVATFSKDTVDSADTLWNALLGESEITVYNIENVLETGVFERLFGYARRKFLGKTKKEELAEKNKKNRFALEIVQDTSAVANVAEKNAVSFSKTLIDSAENAVMLIPTFYDNEPIENVYFFGKQEILNFVENTGNAIGNTLKYTYGYFTPIIKNARKNPVERTGEDSAMGMYEGKMQGPLDVETIYDETKEIVLSPVYGVVNIVKDVVTSSTLWKVVEASSDFFYIFCALAILGKFDFLLENTYALAVITVILVYLLNRS